MLKKTLLASVLALASVGAFAQSVYVQANVGRGTIDLGCGTNCDQNGTGSKILGGYTFGNGFAIEAQDINYGSKSDGVKATSYGVNVAYLGNFDSSFGYRLAAGIGRTKATDQLNNYTTTKNGLTIGLGASYNITPALSAVIDYDYTPVKLNYNDIGVDFSGSAALLSLGLRYKF